MATIDGTNIRCDETCCPWQRTVAKLKGTSVEILHEHHGTRHVATVPVLELLRAVNLR